MSATPQFTPHSRFTTTRWSVVLAASGPGDDAARQSLEILCQRYWTPLYSYVRRRGYSREDAQDLTQEFFTRFVENNWVIRANQTRGRFRLFMLMVLKRFLTNEWHKDHTQKRGGNMQLESLSEIAESMYSMQHATTATPEIEFERDWACTLLDNVLCTLRNQYSETGKEELFTSLKKYLTATEGQHPYAVSAAESGMSESAYKTAVSRLRQRYRDTLRQEVAATVARPEDVDAELKHLFRILARS